MTKRSWVWEDKLQRNNVENVIWCFFFFFSLSLASSELISPSLMWTCHLPRAGASDLMGVARPWGLPASPACMLQGLEFPVGNMGVGTHTQTHRQSERKQWRCEIWPSSLRLLIVQAGHVLTRERNWKTHCYLSICFQISCRASGAASQLLRTPHPASPTAGPLCQFRNKGNFLLVLFSTRSYEQVDVLAANKRRTKIRDKAVAADINVDVAACVCVCVCVCMDQLTWVYVYM